MKLSALKKIRVIITLLFFILTAILFLDISHALPYSIFDSVLFLQFIPSLIQFITLPSIIAGGFLVILALTLLFGRVYCSTICPIGTLQDIISFMKKKFKKKKSYRYEYSKPHNFLRIFFLVATVIVYLAGSLFLINLLDPFSNFGRIISDIFRPIYIYINNILASIFESADIYYFTKVDYSGIRYELLLFPISMLFLLAWLAAKYGRLYCNTVCPVGMLLGLLSKYSIFKIGFNTEECTECGLCEKACKSSCIDYENKVLDFDRCVNCFNCFKACKSDGFKYELRYKKVALPEEPQYYKREMLKGAAIALIGAGAISDSSEKSRKKSSVPENSQNAVTPPGSKSFGHYTDACTACHLCVSACPTQVLQPAFLEYGLLGILQPKMDYHKSFCNYECAACGEVCPSGAIQPLSIEDKRITQTGIAKFIKGNCVVATENTDCGACAEHCPTKAVHMVPYEEKAGLNLRIPEVNEATCIGCGACEYACPTRPYKAIYVKANDVHQKAEKPKFEELDKDVDYEEDFPF